MPLRKKFLVVTDLDATLLDHNYSSAEAEPALARLRALGFPVVMNSSKTLAEMRPLAETLRLEAPIIAENGGVLALPESIGQAHSVEIKGLARGAILDAAHALRASEGYHFKGFTDWSAAELSDLTGLTLEQARASGNRLATEPILWEDSEANRLRFAEALAEAGVRMLQGGRFWHLMGGADKADGVAAVRRYYESREPDVHWQVLALGDSANDTAMLEAADIAVVVPHAEGPRIEPRSARVLVAPEPAAAGWNAAVLTLLNEI